MLSEWKDKATQGEFIRQYPTQIMKQAKRVWKWAIERGEGKAWLYYIFGICQWLPLNHRTHYNEKSGRGLEKCFLFLTNSVESQAHLYQCPALNQEQSDINVAVSLVFKKWKLFEADYAIVAQNQKICKQWQIWTRNVPIFATLDPDRLSFIVQMYWRANHTKPNLSFRCFTSSFRKAIMPVNAQALVTPESLVSILTKWFSLQIQANTNILHKSFLVDDWQSSNPDDGAFGAKIDSLKEVLLGRNSFVLSLGRQGDVDLKIMTDLLASHHPTRVICIAQTEKIGLITHGSRNCLEIVRFEQGLPFIRSDTNTQDLVMSSISIGLFMNKESMIFDSLDWFAFKEELRNWATNLGIKCVTPPLTDALFGERIFPKHCRAFPSHSSSNSLFHFFDGRREKTNEVQHLMQAGFSSSTAKLLAKINKHKPELSALGILPNHLRTFLKTSIHCEEALADLAQTLFWKGFKLWKKRAPLRRIFGRTLRNGKT